MPNLSCGTRYFPRGTQLRSVCHIACPGDACAEDYGGGDDGQFVVAGGKSAPLFEQCKRPFDEIALFVADLVERGRSTTRSSTTFPCAALIALLWDDSGDLAATWQALGDSAGVGAVGDHRIRT
jgi:hypothetical protein